MSRSISRSAGRKMGLACLIAVIIAVFAFSAFINAQRDHHPDSEKIVGD